MKDRILDRLLRNQGEYVSGEELSREFGVSRTAIWKHIADLRGDGYQIEAHSRLGYRLQGSPDRLLPAEVRRWMEAGGLGAKIIHHESVGSTNDEARALAAAGAPEGTVVVAEEQTGGKGRLGRRWESPRGTGVWLSVILRPPLPPAEVSPLTLMAAVAVAEAIERATGLRPGIKWPNDVLVNGRKVCGILTELSAEVERINHVILGIGINVNLASADLPEEVRGSASSLAAEAGAPVSRARLAGELLSRLDYWYRVFLRQGFDPAREVWKRYSITLGRPVTASSRTQRIEGIAVDVEGDGALLIEMADGSRQRVLAGEVTLRAIPT